MTLECEMGEERVGSITIDDSVRHPEDLVSVEFFAGRTRLGHYGVKNNLTGEELKNIPLWPNPQKPGEVLIKWKDLGRIFHAPSNYTNNLHYIDCGIYKRQQPSTRETQAMTDDYQGGTGERGGGRTPLVTATAARASKTREELARNLSAIRTRIANIVPAEMTEGDVVVGKDGKLKVQKVAKPKYAEAADKAREALVSDKYSVSIADQIADVLLKHSNSFTTQLANEVNSLKIKKAQLSDELQKRVRAFQLEQFLNEQSESLQQCAKENVGKNKDAIKALASLLNIKPETLKETFVSSAEIYIKEICGKTEARRALEETVNTLVATSATLETKQATLSSVSSELKDELIGKLKGHLQNIAEQTFVKTIALSGTLLTVTVGQVVVKWGTKRYFLGDFNINIKLNVQPTNMNHEDVITFSNLTIGNDSEYHSPHIKAHGTVICWGTAFKSALALFNEWNFAVLIGFLWKYLSSYNDGSKFCDLPTVSKIAVRCATRKGIPIPQGCEKGV